MHSSDRRRPYVAALHDLTRQVLSNTGDVPPDLLDFSSRLLDWAARLRRLELNRALHEQFGGVVQDGPFAGMQLVNASSWADGDLAPRLIGSYEDDLYPAIERFSARAYDLIVNLGCAEGYYAVGMARLFPDARVCAYDTIPKALEICQQTAAINGVASRIQTGGGISAAELETALAVARSPLIVCDIEGAELEVLDPAVAPTLARADLIVECHDTASSPVTDILSDRFAASHTIEEVVEGSRDHNRCTLLHDRSMLERWVSVCEFRGPPQNWLVMEARNRKSGWLSRLRGG